MSEQTKILVPKLRFPEFHDSGDWTEIELINTADKKIKWSFIGGPFGSNLKSSDYVKNGIRVIQLQNIGDANFIDDYQIFTSEEKANELLSNNIYPGEIILSKMGDPVGRACLIPETHDRYVMCSDGIRLVVDERSHSKYFIYSLINSSQFRALVEKTATGSTRKRIGLDDLKSLPMVVPKKEEQQKIADCLSSIDQLITAQTKKIDALKDHKKGLMQQLFPLEGETVPKLRFPEFQDAGEWEEKSLGGIGEIVTGKTPSTSDASLWNGDIQFVTPTDISEEKYQWETQRSVASNAKLKVLPKHSIMFTCIASIGKMALSVKPCITNQQINTLIPNKAYLNEFVYYSLLNIVPLIKGTQANSTLPIINKTEFSKFTAPVPKVHAEQQKIAECLSSIDELITTQTQKLKALKAHKKGLLQQLFPIVDEVGE